MEAAARQHAHNVAPVYDPSMPPPSGGYANPWQEQPAERGPSVLERRRAEQSAATPGLPAMASPPPMPVMPQVPIQTASGSDVSGDARSAALATAILSEFKGDANSIRAEHKRVKSRLREYELAFEQQHGRKPRKKKDWQPVFEEYERYAALREAEKLAQLNTGSARRNSGSI